MIKLNSEKYESKQVENKKSFNNGKAGVVTTCDATIIRKGVDEADNLPEYKLDINKPIEKDGFDYGVNKGFFYKGDFDPEITLEEGQSVADANKAAGNFKSDAGQTFAINELTHLFNTVVQQDLKEVKTEFNSYNEMLDFVMSLVIDPIKTVEVDVAVDYGTPAWPKQRLQLNGHPWYIKRTDDDTHNLSLRVGVLESRPTPDAPFQSKSTEAKSDLPWD